MRYDRCTCGLVDDGECMGLTVCDRFERHYLTVRGWLLTLAVKAECGDGKQREWARFESFEAVQAEREIRATFLRPLTYFGDEPSLSLTVRGHAARLLWSSQ